MGVLRSSIQALALRGTAVIVGAPAFGTEVPIDVNFMIGGRRVVGLTLGDAETQTSIPTLVEHVTTGRLPIDRLITQYRLDDIQQAVADMTSGSTIKPVLRT